MTPRKAPLQEAERNRCAGGRAAWMPREARRAMDGPSRRAPGATMQRGNPAQPGRMLGQAFWFLWGDCQRDSPGKAKQKSTAHWEMSQATESHTTLPTQRAHTFPDTQRTTTKKPRPVSRPGLFLSFY